MKDRKIFRGLRRLGNTAHLLLCAAVCLIVLGIGCTTAFGSTVTGLDFPGSNGTTVRFRFLNPLPIYPATYIWRAYPREQPADWPPAQPYYYTTFFWANDDGKTVFNGDYSTFLWDSGSANTYYGAHPFPLGGPPFIEKWEIASDGNDYTSNEDVAFRRWYTQALVAWADENGYKHTAFYWDLSDPSRVITHVSDRSYGNTNPPYPALTFGDAPWHPGWEVYNGILRGIRVYSTNLSLSDILSEANSPLSTSSGIANIWYLNVNPTPDDISDKSGRGHNPSWVGSGRPSTWSGVDNTPPADNTPPVIAPSITGTQGNNGWYRSSVTVTWSVTDPESGITASSGCAPATLSADTPGVTLTCTATNGVGLSTSASVTIKIDKTPSLATATPIPGPNANRWNNTSVTVSFSGTDNLSSIDLCSAPITFSHEGAGQTAIGMCTDKAGNVSIPVSATVNIDETPPEAFSLFDPVRKGVQISGHDLLSGVPSGAITGTCAPTKWGGDDDDNDDRRQSDARKDENDGEQQNNAQLCTYTISDLAWNNLLLVARVKTSNSSRTSEDEDGHDLKFQVVSTQYNSGSVINAPYNLESFEWSVNKDKTLRKLNQTVVIGKGKDRIEVSLKYDGRKNQTTIEADKPKQSKAVPGLVLLRMVTSKGTLNIVAP